MDSNDSQFNMWNDLSISFPNPFFVPVNELDPIINDFNDISPSILNDDTSLYIPFSIFNDCNKSKLNKWNDVEFPNDPFPIDNVVKFGISTLLMISISI